MPLEIRLPDEVAARLRSEAAKRGVTADELFAEVIAEHLDHQDAIRSASRPSTR